MAAIAAAPGAFGQDQPTPAPADSAVLPPIIGGVPILIGGKVVGGVGASGESSENDEQAAKAGLAVLK